jgi:hypothetical protein
MTGDNTLLKKIKMGKAIKITYGDGSQSKVIEKGLMEILGFQSSQEALYVEGLKANLLSISQICDNDHLVQVSKKERNIFDCNGKWLMGGERTAYNYYGLSSLTSEPQIKCNKVIVVNCELWHQRLGHLNYNDLIKIANKEVIKDLPKITKIEKRVCGPCQLGKQTRVAHKKTSGILPNILNFFTWIS